MKGSCALRDVAMFNAEYIPRGRRQRDVKMTESSPVGVHGISMNQGSYGIPGVTGETCEPAQNS
ncbi:MAG TPA: hypothetical protein VEL11_09225 [Candidatus Bathyarchaeia archaeon]|nr:hypothetical protein [Candidatus Bathyarchaeia archaeon]